MAKYTEAFCTTTGGMVSIMQMRSEYNHDPAVYEKVYKGHLFCPGCQAVPLTVVHANGTLFYRGHPHEEHADGCWYALDERVVKSVTEINGDIEEQALSQLDSLLQNEDRESPRFQPWDDRPTIMVFFVSTNIIVM